MIHRFFLSFYFYSALCYHAIVRISLGGVYKLFISILRNMVKLSEGWCTFNRFNSPVVFLLLPVPRRCPPMFHLYDISRIFYAYCILGSCLFCVLTVLALEPTSFHSFCPLMYGQFAVRSLCTFVQSPFFKYTAFSTKTVL